MSFRAMPGAYPSDRPGVKAVRGATAWLGDVDSNHDKQSQSLLSYR